MDITFTLSELQKIGLTQNEIARAVGCAQSTISDMTAGKAGVKNPSYKVMSGLQALAEKHGIATPPKRRKTDRDSPP